MTTNEDVIGYLENRIELVDSLTHSEKLSMFSSSFPTHYKLLKLLPEMPHALSILQNSGTSELIMCEEQAWLNYLEYAQEICRDPFDYIDDLHYILGKGIIPFMTLKWCDQLCTHLVTRESIRLHEQASHAYMEHAARAVLRPRDSYAPGDFSIAYHHVDDQHCAGVYWNTIHDMGISQAIRAWDADPVLSINPLTHTNFLLHPKMQALGQCMPDPLIMQEVTAAVCRGWKQYVDEKLDQYAEELLQGAPCQEYSIPPLAPLAPPAHSGPV